MKKIALVAFSLFIAFFFSACNAMLAKMTQKNATQIQHYGASKSVINELVIIQHRWQNTPYRLGGVSVSGADCSGFIQSVFREHFHTQIPRTTTAQLESGVKIAGNKLKAGDILFFKTGRGPHGLHTGIFVEKDEFIHLSTNGGVKRVSMNSSYWKPKFIGARRYLR